MISRFDDNLLTNFAQTFYGYGDYNGPYWFVGMEEAGGDSFEEVEKRLLAWNNRGQRELEDVASFHCDIGYESLFNGSSRIQPTWNKLIRIILSAVNAEGYELELKMVQHYLQNSLGRLSGQICLIELFPLPSPSTAHWIYAEHSALAHLINKDTYKKFYVYQRIKHIKERIEHYKPKAVVFYSSTFQDWWRQIAAVPFISEEENGVFLAKQDGTIFIITKHPATYGITNEYFHNVGRRIAFELKQ